MRWLLLLLLAGCGPKEPTSGGGEAYYKALNCRACHIIGSDGAGRGGPDLTLVGFRKSPAFLDRFLKDPQAWKKDTLMPNPRLSEKAREQLVAYLASLKGQNWKDKRPWDGVADRVEKGKTIYVKAGCVTCHGPSGAGGYPNNNVEGGKIPALNGVSETYTKEELKRKIKKGVYPAKKDPAGEDPLLRMPAWIEYLSDEEVDAVADYLRTLKPGAGAPAW